MRSAVRLFCAFPESATNLIPQIHIIMALRNGAGRAGAHVTRGHRRSWLAAAAIFALVVIGCGSGAGTAAPTPIASPAASGLTVPAELSQLDPRNVGERLAALVASGPSEPGDPGTTPNFAAPDNPPVLDPTAEPTAIPEIGDLFDILGIDPDEVCDDHTAGESVPVEILESLCEEDPVVHRAPAAPIAFDVEIVAAPSNGAVATQPDGTVIYTPDPGFTGIDAYIYRTIDALGASVTSSVLVSVGEDGGAR